MFEGGDAPPGRDYLPIDSAAQTGGKECEGILRALAAGGREGPAHVLVPAAGNQFSHSIARNPAVQLPQLAGYGIGKRQLGCRREALDAFAAVQDRGPGKLYENGFGKMWMPKHQLSLGQGGQLDLGGRRDGGVSGGGQLVDVHPAINPGTRVANHSTLYLGAELLG